MKQIYSIILIFLFLCYSCVNDEKKKLLKKEIQEIFTNYTQDEVVYIFGGNKDLFYKENNKPKYDKLIDYLEQNRPNVKKNIAEVNRSKEIQELKEVYLNSLKELRTEINKTTEEYEKYGIEFITYDKTDSYYYFAARNGQRLIGGQIQNTEIILLSDINKTSSDLEAPEIEDLFKFKDAFEKEMGNYLTSKVKLYVIKGRYADVSVFRENLKLKGFYVEKNNELESNQNINDYYKGYYKYETSFVDNVVEAPLREKPNINSKKLYNCPKNSKIYVLDDFGETYFKVNVNGYSGYLSKGLLQLENKK